MIHTMTTVEIFENLPLYLKDRDSKLYKLILETPNINEDLDIITEDFKYCLKYTPMYEDDNIPMSIETMYLICIGNSFKEVVEEMVIRLNAPTYLTPTKWIPTKEGKKVLEKLPKFPQIIGENHPLFLTKDEFRISNNDMQLHLKNDK